MTPRLFAIPTVFAFAVILGVTALNLSTAAIYGTQFEGDVIHLMDIVLRMVVGELPHLDFMTPIGILAFAPISIFVATGVEPGHSVFLGQAVVAVALTPLVVWVAVSRFDGWLRLIYVAVVLVFALGLVQGTASPQVSLSMHYNRWGWALAFVALPCAMLPSRRHHGLADALAIALPLAALILLKATFAIALIPGIVALLLGRRQYKCLALGLGIGTFALAGFTLWSGLEYWFAYSDDLLATAGSASRAYPGLPIDKMIVAPDHLVGHAAILASIILLRRIGDRVLGLGLLLLVPGFVYITWQNFENDPVWTAIAGIVLLASSGQSARPNQGLVIAAVVLLGVSAPSVVNIAYSPIRNASADPAEYTELIPGHHDLLTLEFRARRMDLRVYGTEQGSADFSFADIGADLQGGAEARCTLELGLARWLGLAAEELETTGFGQKRVLVADLIGPLWLFSTDFPRLAGSAPWVYGGAPGLDMAEMLLVPTCPTSRATQTMMLEFLANAGYALERLHETDRYALYDLRPDQPIAANVK